ncbi:hypothetical protein ACGGZK_00780 [Agromyces sp. MMS24-K17]|uniref:hypothetical protein n=1 Tax=Agromyces sp. MMS24-K17 TaxID=3372850 RepID=UPI00375540B0
MSRTPTEVADRVGSVFAEVFDRLADWRTAIEARLGTGRDIRPADLDDAVADLVLPRLEADDPLLVGAGFIADGEVVRGRDVHFAWWLGPLDDNPVLGSTDRPTRLDLSTRGYAEYLRDFRALEWYRIPATTRRAHVTGPYVDHLCTCDYILTLTMPVHVAGLAGAAGAAGSDAMVGVVGADIAVRRLERALLGAFLEVDAPLALVNEHGRVVLSTDPALQVGQLAPAAAGASIGCPGTPFSVLVGPVGPGAS